MRVPRNDKREGSSGQELCPVCKGPPVSLLWTAVCPQMAGKGLSPSFWNAIVFQEVSTMILNLMALHLWGVRGRIHLSVSYEKKGEGGREGWLGEMLRHRPQDDGEVPVTYKNKFSLTPSSPASRTMRNKNFLQITSLSLWFSTMAAPLDLAPNWDTLRSSRNGVKSEGHISLIEEVYNTIRDGGWICDTVNRKWLNGWSRNIEKNPPPWNTQLMTNTYLVIPSKRISSKAANCGVSG